MRSAVLVLVVVVVVMCVGWGGVREQPMVYVYVCTEETKVDGHEGVEGTRRGVDKLPDPLRGKVIEPLRVIVVPPHHPLARAD